MRIGRSVKFWYVTLHLVKYMRMYVIPYKYNVIPLYLYVHMHLVHIVIYVYKRHVYSVILVIIQLLQCYLRVTLM